MLTAEYYGDKIKIETLKKKKKWLNWSKKLDFSSHTLALSYKCSHFLYLKVKNILKARRRIFNLRTKHFQNVAKEFFLK